MAGYMHWVIHNDQGEVIHWGRTKRLFEGAARRGWYIDDRCIGCGASMSIAPHLIGGASDGRSASSSSCVTLRQTS